MNENRMSEDFVAGFMSKCAEAGLTEKQAAGLLGKALIGVGRRVAPSLTSRAVGRQAARLLPAMRANGEILAKATGAARRANTGLNRLSAFSKYLERKYPNVDAVQRAFTESGGWTTDQGARLIREIRRDIGLPHTGYGRTPLYDPKDLFAQLRDIRKQRNSPWGTYFGTSLTGSHPYAAKAWEKTVDKGGLGSRFSGYLQRAANDARFGEFSKDFDAVRHFLPYANRDNPAQLVKVLSNPANRGMFLRQGIV